MPFHAFLSRPRRWTAIRRWSRERRLNLDVVRNILAFLDLHGIAVATFDGRCWCWQLAPSVVAAP